MSEKRRVLASTNSNYNNTDTPSRVVAGSGLLRGSSSVNIGSTTPSSTGRARVANAAAIINKPSTASPGIGNGAGGGATGAATPTSHPMRATPTANRQGASALSPGVSAVRARVLGYQEGPLVASSVTASANGGSTTTYRGPSTPSTSSISNLAGPVTTPGSSYPLASPSLPSSSSSSSTQARASPFGVSLKATFNASVVTPGARAAGSTSKHNATNNGITKVSATSAASSGYTSTADNNLPRKIRAASTPPQGLSGPDTNSYSAGLSNNVTRPASPRRRAFPALQSSSSSSSNTDQFASTSSPSPSPVPSSYNATSAKIRKRGISTNRLDASTSRATATSSSSATSSAASGSNARAGIAVKNAHSEPSKPVLSRAQSSSKSMTSRPISANLNTLLPSPTIRTSTSTIFTSGNKATSTASSSDSMPPRSPTTIATGRSPSPSRPRSPVRSQTQGTHSPRAASPIRPPSPVRNVPFKPVLSSAALQGSTPRRPTRNEVAAPNASSALASSPIRNSNNIGLAGPSSPMTAKRPSTSSQSSSAYSNTTADTSGTSAATSPDNHHSFTTSDPHKAPAALSSQGGSSVYHRTRRRSHSTNSSVSSVSAVSGLSAGKNVSDKTPYSHAATVTAGGISNTRPRGNSQATLQQSTRVPAGSAAYASSSTTTSGNSPTVAVPPAMASPMMTSPLGVSSPSGPNSVLSPSLLSSSPGKGLYNELERQAHADAKVNRKILDLEITNTSLLAINNSLEKAKAKQASEIRDLRRRLRERSLAPIHSAPLLGAAGGGGGIDGYDWQDGDHPHDNENIETEMTWEEILKEDERFADMVRLLDGMKTRAKEALEKTVKSEEKQLGGRVLNAFSMSMPVLPASAALSATGTAANSAPISAIPFTSNTATAVSSSNARFPNRSRMPTNDAMSNTNALSSNHAKQDDEDLQDTSTATVSSTDMDTTDQSSFETSKASFDTSANPVIRVNANQRKSTPRSSDANEEGNSMTSLKSNNLDISSLMDESGVDTSISNGSSSFDISRNVSSSEFSISID